MSPLKSQSSPSHTSSSKATPPDTPKKATKWRKKIKTYESMRGVHSDSSHHILFLGFQRSVGIS